MRFNIRESRAGDFDHLFAIDQECFPVGIAYSRRELAHYMNARGSFTLVAETGRSPKIAGFIVGRVHPRGLGHIITIDAVATYRRCGLGTLLMTAAEDRLKASGCDAIFLEAAVNNLTALAFYKKLDYYILKTLPRYYNKEMDAFLLVKRLAKAR